MGRSVIKQLQNRTGRTVANHFVVEGATLEEKGIEYEGSLFVSYDTNIAFITSGSKLFLDENKWDYSRTTSKYLNIFLEQNCFSRVDKKDAEKIDLNN